MTTPFRESEAGALAAMRGQSRATPCSVRCWRVGAQVPTKPGEPCVECGRIEPGLATMRAPSVMKAVWFCDGYFHGSADVATEDEFVVFEKGLRAGAYEYGGATWAVYLLPRDHAKMLGRELPKEAGRASERTEHLP